MYDTIPKPIYSCYMANNVYNTVPRCLSCTRNRWNNEKEGNQRLFPAVYYPEVFTIEILSTLSKAEEGINYIFVITDHYVKLNKLIPTAKTTVTMTSNIIIEKWLQLWNTYPCTDGHLGPNSFDNVLPHFARNEASNGISYRVAPAD